MATQPADKATKSVPFIGWSQAAARFREVANAIANSSTSVLLLGPSGVGKKEMARAWIHAAGGNRSGLSFVDLDLPDPAIRGTTVAISRKGLSPTQQYLNLGTGLNEHSPESDQSIPLSDDVLSRFSVRLFMPPLRQRPIDVLALLHFFNKADLQRQLNHSYESISAPLLYDLISSEWRGNARELKDYLIASAQRTLRDSNQPNDSLPHTLGVLRHIPGLPVRSVLESIQETSLKLIPDNIPGYREAIQKCFSGIQEATTDSCAQSATFVTITR